MILPKRRDHVLVELLLLPEGDPKDPRRLLARPRIIPSITDIEPNVVCMYTLYCNTAHTAHTPRLLSTAVLTVLSVLLVAQLATLLLHRFH